MAAHGSPSVGLGVTPCSCAAHPVGVSSTELRLSLTSKDSTTEWLAVPAGDIEAAIDVQPDPDKTGTVWVADLEWTVEAHTDNEKAQPFSPVVQFNNTTPAKNSVSVPGGIFIRLKTTTQDGDSDASAPVTLVFNRLQYP